MTAQVLAQQSDLLTDKEWLVLHTLRRYTKPVKTKHLANNLKADRPSVVNACNRLEELKLIYWHVPKRYDDKQYYGWKVVA